MDKNITRIRREFDDSRRSAVKKYQDLFVGSRSLLVLLKYELVNALALIPGAMGLYLRLKLYPLVLGRVGRNTGFGRNIVFRHPSKIFIGDNSIMDDSCLLDAKGADNEGIIIGDNVFIGRNTILSCKNGDIRIGDGANIGFNCEIFSSSRVVLGRNVLLAAYTYIIGGSHEFSDSGKPFVEQKEISSGITIGENVWLGAGVKVLDGVEIGDDSIVGAGAVVSESLPAGVVAVGMPARVIKQRHGAGEQ